MKIIIHVILSLWIGTSIQAQVMDKEVLTSSGGSYTVNNIHFDWTLGELMTETYEHFLTLEQGFLHQSSDNSLTTSNTRLHHTEANSLIYPNPASQFFKIQSTEKYDQVALLTPNGTPVKEWSKIRDNSIIQIQDLTAGAYLVVIKNKDKIIAQSPIIITQ